MTYAGWYAVLLLTSPVLWLGYGLGCLTGAGALVALIAVQRR